jgi:hypothetical protein
MTFHVRQPRTRLLIDPVVQGAVIRQQLIHWSITLVVVIAGLLLFQVLGDGGGSSLTDHLVTLWSRFGMLLLALLCVFPLFVYDSIRLTHRFAGPVFALHVALRKLANGQRIHEVAFRSDDFWNELAQDINRIAARLDQQQLAEDSGARAAHARATSTADTC